MDKYSKSNNDIASIKQDFLNQNASHLSNASKINKIYTSQAKRRFCKTCNSPISEESGVDFKNHGVDYSICDVCGHINGLHEDTEVFVNQLYAAESGRNYSSNYLANYQERVEKIYIPKVDFLYSSLKNEDIVLSSDFSITDFGCGGGHFVNAATKKGIEAFGIDISKHLIGIAREAYINAFPNAEQPPFQSNSDERELLNSLQRCDSTVASFIGVLEHLKNPNDFIDAYCHSPVKYLYISVPLFSLSVFIENIFTSVFPRQLSGGHTHLYTHKSLQWITEKFSLEKVSAWHFGTDAMDLRRSMICALTENRVSSKAKDLSSDHCFSSEVIDQVQQVLDRSMCTSESYYNHGSLHNHILS